MSDHELQYGMLQDCLICGLCLVGCSIFLIWPSLVIYEAKAEDPDAKYFGRLQVRLLVRCSTRVQERLLYIRQPWTGMQ